MGLLKRFFGGSEPRDAQPLSSQFPEMQSAAQRADSANAARRELLQGVLRDTVRRQGIPADWIGCHVLPVVSRRRGAGMHVHFIVKNGPMQLSSVHDFQRSFRERLEQFEPRAREWLFSIAWQFDAPGWAAPHSPGQSDFSDIDTEPQSGGDTQPLDSNDELQADLRALYAIRDAALAGTLEAGPAQTAPSPARGDPTGS